MLNKIKYFSTLTLATLLITVGVYFFKFPNNFTFGGVTAFSVLAAHLLPLSAGTINLIANLLLLVIGCFFLGRGFIATTAYCSVLLSVSISALEYLVPLTAPLTDQPVLELCFAIILPAIGSAILFNIGSSSGGTDIVAMIMKKYSSMDIGRALLVSNCLITFASFLVFDITTALYSILGLAISSLLVDNVIESINQCKYFNVVCNTPEPICNYITQELHRSATTCNGTGAFTGKNKFIIFTVMSRVEAVKLRNFIKEQEPTAFILISNTSQIIGKGFHTV
ncbi:MAG: YitT family protein [Eubacteriales bacterium]